MNGWSLKLAIILLLLAAPNLTGATGYGIPLDAPEQAAQAETLRYAMEHNQINQESTWVNPATGHSGTIMPVRGFYSSQGLHCREYFQTLRFDDTLERLLGIACRQPDGVWEVMHEQFLGDAYLELDGAPYPYLDRDPYDHDYPWVYYDPFDYPHPIFFSFVFVSHRHHFEPRHFHSGHRFNTQHFRDGRHLAPRQRLPRDQRLDAPVVREQPTAPRFDRGAAPPRQRVESDPGRGQRQAQPEASPPAVRPRGEEPVRRPQPPVTEGAPPAADNSPNSGRLERREPQKQPAETPPREPRLRDNRKQQHPREDPSLRREAADDDRGKDREETRRRDDRSDDDDRDRRGKESRGSERRQRDRDDRDEGQSGSEGRGRSHR